MIKTFLDLCSGIGGGRLGLEKAGLKCIGYSDTSRLAKRTYELMHDTTDETYYYNLKRIDTDSLPLYDMLIAGFPCQTFSVIGRKDGFDDKRGQIIFHIARILEHTQPKCFLLENVKGLVTHDKGKTLNIILNELDRVGYDVTYKVLTSLDYGVPQMRQRVYFIGINKKLGLNINNFTWPDHIPKPNLKEYLIDNHFASDERLDILKYYLNNPTNNGKYSVKDICQMEGKIIDTRMNDLRIYDGKCPTLRAQRDGILYIKNGAIHQLTGYEALLLQGFPKGYADKVKDLVTDRHLLMQAGNAMTVNVIELLGKQIINFISPRRSPMSKRTDNFEIECTNRLTSRYNAYAQFIRKGGSDSTTPDIHVRTKSGKSFYIEAKLCPAQCGQFVLLPDIETQSFTYSSDNDHPINIYAQKIMELMNHNFDAFMEAGTAGKEIIMPDSENIFSGWIIQAYKEKNARFFIKNDYIIFPIEDITKHFNITAKYRIKRSGSSDVRKSNFESVKNFISGTDYMINSYIEKGSKLFVESPQSLHDHRFILSGYEYMFSQRDDLYEVRKLSNTYNANVIFSVTDKGNNTGLSESEFIDELN